MQRTGAVHPYRDAPELASNEEAPPRVSDESVLITALLVLGGIRVLVAALAGKWLEAEVTLAAFLLAAGVVWGLRRTGRRARRWWRRSRTLHGRRDPSRFR